MPDQQTRRPMIQPSHRCVVCGTTASSKTMMNHRGCVHLENEHQSFYAPGWVCENHTVQDDDQFPMEGVSRRPTKSQHGDVPEVLDHRSRRWAEEAAEVFPSCRKWRRIVVCLPDSLVRDFMKACIEEEVSLSIAATVALGWFCVARNRNADIGRHNGSREEAC